MYDWVVAICVVLLCICVGFFFFMFMPKPVVFFNPYVDLRAFSDNFENIKSEILQTTKQSFIPIYGENVILSNAYPQTYAACLTIPYVKYIGIINLKGKISQKPEYNYDKIANNTIRYFLTIKKTNSLKSGIWIDGESRFFEDGEWICGDMSREHSLYNNQRKSTTTLLFIDIQRDKSIPIGSSINKEKDQITKIFEAKINSMKK